MKVSSFMPVPGWRAYRVKPDGFIEETPVAGFAVQEDGELVAVVFRKNAAVPVEDNAYVTGPRQPRPSILRLLSLAETNHYNWSEIEKDLAAGKIKPPPGVTIEEFIQIVAEVQNERFS